MVTILMVTQGYFQKCKGASGQEHGHQRAGHRASWPAALERPGHHRQQALWWPPVNDSDLTKDLIEDLTEDLTEEAVSVAAALAELEVSPDDRVLIMLPDGPGFIDAFIGVTKQGAVPLAVNPHLEAADVAVAAAEFGAGAALITAQRVPALAGLGAKPPVPVNGPQGLWAAAVRLR